MNETQANWIASTANQATGVHIFPVMAACEAAEESKYGLSELARDANNLFGMKQHKHPVYGTLSLPTKEFLGGEWEPVIADWVKYPDVASCFQDRMATLNRLANVNNSEGVAEYPHYRAAISVTDEISYVTEVSKTWSTDPNRAKNIIAIYNTFKEFNAPTSSVALDE